MLQIACHVPRPTAPGQIDRSSHFFHSDCSVQHASTVYTDLLKANGIAISMSRSGNPYDNALKYERCTAANTGTWRRRAPRSAGSSKRTATKNACTTTQTRCTRRATSEMIVQRLIVISIWR
jgi:hypothetical protein